MHITHPDIERYLDQHASAEDPVLKALDRETHIKFLSPHMVSGHVQGLLLATLARSLNARRILEIGTFTGYSGICLAQGLSEDGLLYTLEVNEELQETIEEYFEQAGLSHKLRLHFGRAQEIIPTLQETFDLVFIDADKKAYSDYLDLVIGMVRPGGLIVADNVLWKGRVADDHRQDGDTKAMRAYNEKAAADPRLRSFILPLRDGLMVSQVL